MSTTYDSLETASFPADYADILMDVLAITPANLLSVKDALHHYRRLDDDQATEVMQQIAFAEDIAERAPPSDDPPPADPAPYLCGLSGTRYTYAEIADRIRREAPQTLGQHIFAQLRAIGLYDEFMNGTTPYGLPFTFAEAAEVAVARHTPGPWAIRGDRDDCDGLSVIQQATGRLICVVESTFGYATADEADARRIAAAVNACEGIRTEALEAGVLRQMREAIERLAYDARGDQDNPLIRDKTLESADRALAIIARATAA
jgi:hypothetical protein